jgi:hypothetical protein
MRYRKLAMSDPSRSRSLVALSSLALRSLVAFAVAVAACGGGDLVIGDDSRSDASVDGGADPDSARPDDVDGATKDSAADGPPVACSAAPAGPGICLPAGSACRQADTSFTCASAGTFCCVQQCPELAQPPPGFCDGGGFAPIYDKNACITGFACTPVACAVAGGTCVGVAPGSCTTGNVGDATKYSCGGGIGVMCCLP